MYDTFITKKNYELLYVGTDEDNVRYTLVRRVVIGHQGIVLGPYWMLSMVRSHCSSMSKCNFFTKVIIKYINILRKSKQWSFKWSKVNPWAYLPSSFFCTNEPKILCKERRPKKPNHKWPRMRQSQDGPKTRTWSSTKAISTRQVPYQRFEHKYILASKIDNSMALMYIRCTWEDRCKDKIYLKIWRICSCKSL